MAAPALSGKDLIATSECITLNNNIKMPVIGLGTWRLKGEKLAAGMYGALSEGYGLIDTAAVYDNEAEIKQLLKEAGNPRVFITSKLQPRDATGFDAALRAFAETKKRLGVDQLDLYLIHWPGTSGVAVDSPDNRRIRLECWKALEQLYEQKQVRAIGVSNYLVRHIEELLADGAKVVPMVNQLEWHPMCWEPEMLQYAKDKKIVLQAYSSLGSGDNRLLVHPVIKEVAKEVNQPEGVVLLRWAVQQGVLIIPCSTSRPHIKENKEALNIKLNDKQMERISSIIKSEQHRFCWDPHTIA